MAPTAPAAVVAATRLADGRYVERWRPGTADPLPSRPTLVLLHGGLDAITTLRDLPADLAAATGCEVVAYDRAGHGRSSGTPSSLDEPVRYRHVEGDAVADLVDELGLGTVVLVGHSDGAAVAMLGAGRHADRFAGVVALAPQLIHHEAMHDGLEAAATAFATGELRDRLARHHPGEPPAGVDAVFAGWSHAWRSGGLTPASVRVELAAIRCPVSVLVGRDDPYGFRANAGLLTDTLQVGWTARFLAGVGHNPHHDARALTRTVVNTFVEELDLAGS